MGRAISIGFVAQGASIIGADWNADRLQQLVATIDRSAGRSMRRPHVLAVEKHGRLDILCNNAGVIDYMQGIGELSDDIWRRVLSIDLDGPMFTTRRAVPRMVAHGGGSIIDIASAAGIGGCGRCGVHRAQAWCGGPDAQYRLDVCERGIRCNAICPGGTRTNIAESIPPDRLDAAGSGHARVSAALTPEVLQPEDIANLALFLHRTSRAASAERSSRRARAAQRPGAMGGARAKAGLDACRAAGDAALERNVSSEVRDLAAITGRRETARRACGAGLSVFRSHRAGG